MYYMCRGGSRNQMDGAEFCIWWSKYTGEKFPKEHYCDIHTFEVKQQAWSSSNREFKCFFIIIYAGILLQISCSELEIYEYSLWICKWPIFERSQHGESVVTEFSMRQLVCRDYKRCSCVN